MRKKSKNAALAAVMSVILFVVSQQCSACSGPQTVDPADGEHAVGEGGGGETVSLIDYKGAGHVSLEVFGIPVQVTVAADNQCQRAVVSIYGAPIIRESRCEEAQGE